jgi:hypothetical protein
LLLAANGRVAPPFWPPLLVEPAALAPDAMVGVVRSSPVHVGVFARVCCGKDDGQIDVTTALAPMCLGCTPTVGKHPRVLGQEPQPRQGCSLGKCAAKWRGAKTLE